MSGGEPYSFEPFPMLSTERLHLRQLQPKDTPEVFALRSNKAVATFLGRACDTDPEQSSQFIQAILQGVRSGDWIYWALNLKGRDLLIGTICLWNFDIKRNCAEIGYELHPRYQSRGLMQEAVEAVIDFGFGSLQLETIEAYLQAANKGSARLLERSHFHFLGPVPPKIKFKTEGAVEMVIYHRKSQK